MWEGGHDRTCEREVMIEQGPTFPCGTCQNSANWEQKGVCCDTCNQWYHADCQNIKSIIYDKMGDLNTSWNCLTCGMPNFSPVLNSTHTGSLYDEGDITLGSISLGAPLAMSSPIPPKRKDNRHHKPTLKLLNVNCRSISDKKGQFQHLIDSTVPDIVVATETWLKPEQGDGEIGEPGRFSADYTIHRRDRPGKSKGGGVFITVKNDLRSTRCEELEPE